VLDPAPPYTSHELGLDDRRADLGRLGPVIRLVP
jgi:hypothetical protein